MKVLWMICAAAFVATALAGGQTMLAVGPDAVSAETRTYDILVDRTAAGQSTLAIVRYGDGSEITTTDAKVTVAWTVFKYVYEFHAQEQWLHGQVQQLNSRAVDGGKRLTLSAVRAERGWQVSTMGGQPTIVGEVHLTTNYWRQPAALSAGGRPSVLDADNGKTYDVRCEHVAQEAIAIGAARITCNHYRLQGAVDVELWFDAAGYLVRQVGTEDGHATELRLVSVQQPALALAKTPR